MFLAGALFTVVCALGVYILFFFLTPALVNTTTCSSSPPSYRRCHGDIPTATALLLLRTAHRNSQVGGSTRIHLPKLRGGELSRRGTSFLPVSLLFLSRPTNRAYQNGDITDPPVSVTNAMTDMDQSPFKVPDFDQGGLFCRTCIRNQHLLVNSLASFLPDVDDPEYPAFDKDLPRYKRTMEERYPQVCENCELRVQDRIRQTKYEAKSDYLRRIMERSKASRATKSARNRNWRHIVDVLGFLVYWASVFGQVLSGIMGAIEAGDVVLELFPSPSLVPLMYHASQMLSRIGYSSQDTATVALIAGVLSIWWNPRLHYKVEGMSGRILGLNQYYECQLIVMAARFGVWALLQDPSRLKPSLPPTLHAVMIVFTCLVSIEETMQLYPATDQEL